MAAPATRQVLAAFLFAAAAAPAAVAAEAPGMALWHGARVETLLDPAEARSLGVAPGPRFDVVGPRDALILTRDRQLYDVARKAYLAEKKPLGTTEFAVAGSTLVIVRGDRLGFYDDGAFKERITLPAPPTAIVAAADGAIYLAGRRGKGGAVWRLKDWKLGTLVATDAGEIGALAVAGNRAFFAVGNLIYTVAAGERPGLLFVAAGVKRIRSLAVDDKAGLVYFASDDAIYALRAGTAVSVARGFSGTLRYANGALYVLNAGDRRLVRITGLEALTLDKPGATPGTAAKAPGAAGSDEFKP